MHSSKPKSTTAADDRVESVAVWCFYLVDDEIIFLHQQPTHTTSAIAARVMDLQEPTNKMSKSAESALGAVGIFEDVESIAKKFKRAVTDSSNEVRFDFESKPGVSNLLSILGAATDRDPELLAEDYAQYGALKADTADAVISVLEPVQLRRSELLADPAELDRIIACLLYTSDAADE